MQKINKGRKKTASKLRKCYFKIVGISFNIHTVKETPE